MPASLWPPAPRCVDVALDVPLFRTFAYRVPAEMAWPIAAGTRVLVPFRNRTAIGICLGETEPPAGVTLKALRAVVDDTPSLPAPLLHTARWIADWYAAPLGLTVRAMLPAALLQPGAAVPASRTQRMVHLVQELPSLLQREQTFARATQQRAVYELLEAQGGAASLESLRTQAGCSAGVFTAMVKRGLIAVRDESVPRDPFAARAGVAPPPHPSPAQRAAIDAILAGDPGQVFLLHGITGSGKTLVYIEVLREVLRTQGRTAIVLVPEIALTSQTVDRFRGAFGNDVAVLHSGLSDGERFDAWQALRRGERRIAVGARSALFAPLEQVGVVIVDEEHESSYKQSETPRYHAREAAIVRARAEGALVVLGSATPSLESWERADRGQAVRLTLPDRAAGAQLPPVQLVDMRSAVKEALASRAPQAPYDPLLRVFSPVLLAAIESRLTRGEQSLLLLNRRGFAAFVQCHGCGDVQVCPHCSISLTYHRVPESLVCHYCQHHADVPSSCARCGHATLQRRGLGTQQVEKLVAERFPEARIARMDVDTTSGKWAHTQILDRVGRQEVDILLGTQMIAKGLDFPNVTLVGVVDADTGLNLPDFRASERTFQLLSQVAGRAGRGPKGGEVIVQTRMPQAHAVTHALTHDFVGFVHEELGARRHPAYPPFVHLANVMVSGVHQGATAAAATAAAEWVTQLMRRQGLRDLVLVGPAPCPIDRIKDRWRWHFLLKSSQPRLMTRVARYVAERCPVPADSGLRLVVDRDPVSLL
ncbi:primosomal protein N' [Gemmatimonas sp.]|jgi:primosomal protein N' (replication factor Y)|uniref:replication restart helicase PriA n=1 Tax=Gemmatimonas sp. TaxID=1962908 RepID=UPI00391FBE2A